MTNLRPLAVAALLLPLLVIAAPSDADAKLAFFRNYPDLKWNVIKTEHFNVFYAESRDPDSEHYIDGEFTARKTAYVAEEMYPLICGQFNYYLDETVNIVMLDQTDSLTGYTVPSFDWIVVSGRHSDLLWRLRGHHDWIRNVMYHEFAHVVSLKADQLFAEEAFGAVVGARWSDGRINTTASGSAFISKGDPWFWVEGGAEYYTDVAGINTWTSNRDMRQRMDTLEDMSLNLDDMGDYFGSHGGFDGNRHYLSGYAFALYLEERFGEGVYQSFALNREESGWTPNWLSVMEDTLNISADELYADWQAWAKSKYEAVRDEVMKDPAIGQRVAHSLPYFESLEPSSIEHVATVRAFTGNDKYKWRKDREALGVYAWGQKFSDNGQMWGRSKPWRGITLRWSPEETFEVFNPDVKSEAESDSIDAWEVSSNYGETIEFGHPIGDAWFDFSPDGTMMVTICREDTPMNKMEREGLSEANADMDGYDWNRLCIVHFEEMRAQATELMVDHFGYDPEERDRLYLEMLKRNIEPPEDKDRDKKGKKWAKRDWGSWVSEIKDRTTYTVFLGDVDRVAYPEWSPDGSTIAFVRYADANQNIWTIDIESGEAKPLTNFDDGTRIEMVDWSPDGSQLVAGVYRWNMQDIYIFDMDGTGRPLTKDRFEDRDPHWGHDGNIYFTSDRVGSIYNVFRIDPRLEPGRLDRDLDGILDADDVCPDERETRNLYRDSDGCPDGIPVRVTDDKIEIDDRVFFELDKAIIKAESHELLDAVARVLNDNPQILSVEIAGHTDSQGDAEYNQELSDRRAQAVLDYLAGQGVDAGRLTSAGYGQTVPLLDELTEEAYAANRRVEFVITAQEEVSKIVEQGAGTQIGGTGDTGMAERALGIDTKAKQACNEGPEAEALRNAYLVQLTNVVSGAFTPSLTPGGHLLYSNYTPWGWQDWGLNCSEFHNQVVDDTSLIIAAADYGLDVPQEIYPDYTSVTSAVPVHMAFWRNPIIIPIIEIANVSLTHIGLNVAVYFSVSDALDTNQISLYFQAGEALRGQIFYRNSRLWPVFSAAIVGGLFKFDYGVQIDDDGDPRTVDDQFLLDFKQGYGFVGAGGSVQLPFVSGVFDVTLNSFSYGTALKTTTSGKKWRPLNFRSINGAGFQLRSPGIARQFSRGAPPNPRDGRGLSFDWSIAAVLPLDEATSGVDPDDGQVFSRYHFNEFHLNYIEYVKLPIKKPNGEDAGHTLQIGVELGFIDRNVPYRDELRGGASGGFNRTNVLQNNTTFSGYEPYSLAGETSALINLQYRFPIIRNIDTKVGPFYLESIHAQIFGTVGNFWSYRVKDDAKTSELFGETILADEDDAAGGGLDKAGTGVIREWPGMVASENGWPVLADVGLEVRFAMNMFNRSPWYSSVRVSYGFMGVSGRGDVDGDGIYTNTSDPTLNNRSDDREPAGFRFLISLGNGW